MPASGTTPLFCELLPIVSARGILGIASESGHHLSLNIVAKITECSALVLFYPKTARRRGRELKSPMVLKAAIQAR